ncbi:MAG: NADPH-dependent F420 reductase [Chloroflexota bacterium]|jgi:NADPH-dependent F420 reductase
MKIAILGGTGPEGSGLGLRWSAAGHEVIIGSRQAEKGERIAAELKAILPEGAIIGTDNLTAANQSDIVVLAVPYAAQAPTLDGLREALSGKILVSVVAPIGKPAARVWRLPSSQSAAEEAQEQLGESVRVVAAFQNVGAHHLKDLDHTPDCDVLICGDKKDDKEIVSELARDAGFRAVNAGALQNASVVEGLTAVLIGINIRHKVKDAGIRITGI